MSNLKPMGLFAGVGGFIGGVLGFGIAGPAAVPLAIKTGIAGGLQVAAISKAEGVLDVVGEKLDVAMDKAGLKLDGAVDKAGEKMAEIADRACNIAEKSLEIWSKFFLIGYGTSIAFNGSQLSAEMFEKYCSNSIYTNPTCIGHLLTTSSFQAFTIITGGCLVREIYNMAVGKK